MMTKVMTMTMMLTTFKAPPKKLYLNLTTKKIPARARAGRLDFLPTDFNGDILQAYVTDSRLLAFLRISARRMPTEVTETGLR